MRNVKAALSVLLIGLVAIIPLSLPETASAQDTIKLGFVADITGGRAMWYKSQRQGIDLFIEETNAAGGILGKKLELLVRDSALNPAKGGAAAEELITKEGCDFLIGPSNSGVATSITRVAQRHKKIVIFHISNSESLTTTDYQPYMMQVVPSTGVESRGLAHFYARRQHKRFSYFGPDYNYARNWWASFKTAISKAKPDTQFVSETWVKVSDMDFSPHMPSLAAANPDVLITNLNGDSLAQFIRQLKPTGLLNKTTLTALCDLELLKEMGNEMPDGILGYDRCAFYGSSDPRMKNFVNKFYTRYQDWPACWAIMVYDGLVALTEAIKKAGTLDSDKVVQAFAGAPYPSVRGPRYIRAEDHLADVGIYVGETGKDSRFGKFSILTNVTYVPAEQVWLPVEEVSRLQSFGKR